MTGQDGKEIDPFSPLLLSEIKNAVFVRVATVQNALDFISSSIVVREAAREKATVWEEKAVHGGMASALENLRDEFASDMATTPDLAPILTGTLRRIRWKGKTKTDFGRVFSILAPLLDCTAADWERHFTGPDGGDMTGATDIHNSGMISRDGTVQSLAAAAKKMEPEKE